MDIVKIISTISNERIDKFLTTHLKTEYDFSRSLIQKWIGEGFVSVNGEIVTANYNVLLDDEIEVVIPDPKQTAISPQVDVTFEIIYEDDDIVVINKPNNLVVHPAPGNDDATLVNGLLYHIKNLSSIGGIVRPGIVHRLDKMTTGLMIVAKTDKAHKKLVEMLQQREIKKTYLGIVRGVIAENKGKIDAPIGRSGSDRKKMQVTDKNSKPAITYFEVVQRLPEYTVVTCQIETGRTHQIRVHMNFIGHPILGDPLYGWKIDGKEPFGQFLHSYQLEFMHPITGKKMLFKCEPPQVFIDKIKELES